MRWAFPGTLLLLFLLGCHRLPVTTLPLASELQQQLAPVQEILDSAIQAGAAPGGVLAISWQGRHAVFSSGRIGIHDQRPPTVHTLYDLASLTKVVALTTLAMLAVEEGRLDLDSTVVHYLPRFAEGTGAKTQITVRQLLLHDSGLPSGRPLWRETGGRRSAITHAITTDLSSSPGTRMVYSDLGAITLTAILEQLYHQRIDHLVEQRITGPLQLATLRYRPPKWWSGSIAPTELVGWRGGEVRGEVHDENAWRMDGISGHAGLFADAAALLRFGEWALDGALQRNSASQPTPPRSFATWTLRQDTPAGSSRGLGWDTPSGTQSSAGEYLAARSFGHTGFTGTSIWIDPERELVLVLLTNRVNPTRDTPAFGGIRGVLSDAVLQLLFPGISPR